MKILNKLWDHLKGPDPTKEDLKFFIGFYVGVGGLGAALSIAGFLNMIGIIPQEGIIINPIHWAVFSAAIFLMAALLVKARARLD